LREDLARIDSSDPIKRFAASLVERGVDQKLIDEALADVIQE